MPKNLWQKERSAIFRDLVRQYNEEGYNQKEAKRLARQEVEEIMEDKDDFVNDIWSNQFDDC
jgi:metal-responsive CopG/Arc/MetJ family transcriptional regulator